MCKMFPLRLFFAHFWRGGLATSPLFTRFRSAEQLPLGTVRYVTLPRPVVAPKSRYAHLPRIFARAALLFVPAVLLVTFLTVKVLRHSAAEQAQMPAYSQDANTQESLDLSAASQPQRPIFPYSIVPGGVRDARELQSVASHDPVVAQHYSDFRIAAAHTVRLEKPLEMYVSYRRNNNVYWTRNRMVIPAGETLISDGENLARGHRRKTRFGIRANQRGIEHPEFCSAFDGGISSRRWRRFFPWRASERASRSASGVHHHHHRREHTAPGDLSAAASSGCPSE